VNREVILCREETEQGRRVKDPQSAEEPAEAAGVVALEQAPVKIAFVLNVGKKYLIV